MGGAARDDGGWAAWTGRRDEARLAALALLALPAGALLAAARTGTAHPGHLAALVALAATGALVLAAARRYSQPARLNPRCSASASADHQRDHERVGADASRSSGMWSKFMP